MKLQVRANMAIFVNTCKPLSRAGHWLQPATCCRSMFIEWLDVGNSFFDYEGRGQASKIAA